MKEIENAVIGALLIEKSAMYEVASMLVADMFVDPCNRKIFEVISSLHSVGTEIDLYTVGMQLDKFNFDMSVLVDKTSCVGSAVNIKTHAEYIVQEYVRRRTAVLAGEVINNSKKYEDVADVVASLNNAAHEINTIVDGRRRSRSLNDILRLSMEAMELRRERFLKGETVGIPTGLTKLDKATGGYRPGDLVVLAARASMGKTAMMLHQVKSAAMAGYNVCVFSLEMGDVKLADRLLLSFSDVTPEGYRNGSISIDEIKLVEKAAGDISSLPINIQDAEGATMMEICSKITLMSHKGKCDIAFVDYLQLCEAGGKSLNREQEVAKMSRLAKKTANKLGIPIVLLSQLSRNVEERRDKMPQLSDLRESGAIEQDADIVIFLMRPEYYGFESYDIGRNTYSDTEGLGILNVAKSRDGRVGIRPFKYNHSLTTISDY